MTRLSNQHPLPRRALRRLLALIPVLLGVTLLTYGLMYLSPSDPVEMLLQARGIPVSDSVVAAMRREAGLDRPFLEQYCVWLWRFVQGDMGISLATGQSVAALLRAALPKTLILTTTSMLATVALSVPLGVWSAVRRGRFADVLLSILSFLGNALPNFLLSLLLLYFFSVKLGLLPVLAAGGPKGLILPTLALAIPMSGKYIRQVRAAVAEQLGRSYVIGAIARGLRPRTVLFRDVLRCAAPTIVTLMSMSVGSLLGGTAAVERIFLWRGIGYLAMDAIANRDYPVIQAFVVWMAVIYVAVNLLTDLSYYFLDPRTRVGLGVE